MPINPELKSDWKRVVAELSPERVVVETKISDADGDRNQRQLKRVGRLWLVPDGSIYVYYTPTHWRAINADQS